LAQAFRSPKVNSKDNHGPIRDVGSGPTLKMAVLLRGKARQLILGCAGLASLACAFSSLTFLGATMRSTMLPGHGMSSSMSSAAAATASSALQPTVFLSMAALGAIAAAAATRGSRQVARPAAKAIGQQLALQQRGVFASGAMNGQCRSSSVVARRFWGEDDDPYSRCTSLKLQIGVQYSKNFLDNLNKLAETADVETEEGLHQLLLDIITSLRRAEPTWRYGYCERLVFDVDDDGARQSTSALQRWGIEAQTKFGDGEDWEKLEKNQPKGVTEFLVLTILVSAYGPICRDRDELKIMSMKDMQEVLDSLAGVQADELIQLDVQWIPEEDGDTLSSMEMTVKFPEFALL